MTENTIQPYADDTTVIATGKNWTKLNKYLENVLSSLD